MAVFVSAGHGAAAVTADREGAILRLGNGRLTVAYDTQKGSFQLASASVAFVEDGRLLQGAGKASLTETDDLLGKGRAIVIDQGAGRSCRLALYPDLPFVCIRQDLVNPTGETIEAVLPPYGCANIALVPADDVPRVLGTSRHVSQGAVDLENETWDPAGMTLGATSKVIANDPYQIRVVFPAGRTLESVALANGGEATIAIEHHESRRARVTILSPRTGPLQWTAIFK